MEDEPMSAFQQSLLKRLDNMHKSPAPEPQRGPPSRPAAPRQKPMDMQSELASKLARRKGSSSGGGGVAGGGGSGGGGSSSLADQLQQKRGGLNRRRETSNDLSHDSQGPPISPGFTREESNESVRKGPPPAPKRKEAPAPPSGKQPRPDPRESAGGGSGGGDTRKKASELAAKMGWGAAEPAKSTTKPAPRPPPQQKPPPTPERDVGMKGGYTGGRGERERGDDEEGGGYMNFKNMTRASQARFEQGHSSAPPSNIERIPSDRSSDEEEPTPTRAEAPPLHQRHGSGGSFGTKAAPPPPTMMKHARGGPAHTRPPIGGGAGDPPQTAPPLPPGGPSPQGQPGKLRPPEPGENGPTPPPAAPRRVGSFRGQHSTRVRNSGGADR